MSQQPDSGGSGEQPWAVCRNHWEMVLDNAIWLAAMLFVLAVCWTEEFGAGLLALLAVLAVAWFAYSVVVWRKTRVEFRETEMVRVQDTIARSEKRLQYDRLASVEIRRSVVNRLLGTSMVLFNVNSSVNAKTAEVRLYLEEAEAEELRGRLLKLMSSGAPAGAEAGEEDAAGTLVRVSNADIVMHAFLAQPTYQAAFGILMLAYAVWSVLADSAGGLAASVALLIVSEALPVANVILKYADYSIRRVGDTVTVECGLLSRYRWTFRACKVNSVRVSEPLLARVLGKAVLDAEVVGLNGEEGRPILCPLKPRAEVEALMSQVVPELLFEPSPGRQPARAAWPTAARALLPALVPAALGILLIVYSMGAAWTAAGLAIIAASLAISLAGGVLAQRNRAFDAGPESFMIVGGYYDRFTEFVSYDKVQMAEVKAGPLERRLGLARCRVATMSSSGFRNVESGIFEPADLERVPSEVVARISDGRYDYRRYLRFHRKRGRSATAFYTRTMRGAGFPWRGTIWRSTPERRASRWPCTTRRWRASPRAAR